MRLYKYLLAVVVFACFLVMAASGQTKTTDQQVFTVGIHESPPFTAVDGEKCTGLSVELWEKIALKQGIRFNYKSYKDLGGLIDAIAEGEVDLSINPLTVTSDRLRRFSFSQPYFISNMAIAVKVSESGALMGMLLKFFSRQFFEVVALLFIVIFVFGALLWLVEHKKNPTHFGKGLKGVGDGIWWSAVTMTTVGYGDKAPKTGLGRLISVIWMFTAVVIISGFTASISAALTYNKLQDTITNIDDLRNFKVGTVKNSSSAEFLRDRRIDFEGFETLDIALEKLDEDKLNAVIYDKPLLSYLIHSKGYNESTEVLPSGVNSVYYSFSSRNDSLLKMINPLLIEVIETPDWNKVLSKYRLHEQ